MTPRSPHHKIFPGTKEQSDFYTCRAARDLCPPHHHSPRKDGFCGLKERAVDHLGFVRDSDPGRNIDATVLLQSWFYTHYSYPTLQLLAIKDKSQHTSHFLKCFRPMDSINMTDQFPIVLANLGETDYSEEHIELRLSTE